MPTIAVLLIFVLFAGIMVLAAVMGGIRAIRSARQYQDMKPISIGSSVDTPVRIQTQKKRLGFRHFLLVVVFGCAGPIMLYIGYQQYQDATASESWPTVLGTVVVSDVMSRHTGDGSTSYYTKVKYEYTVNDSTYTSDQVTFSDSFFPKRSQAQEIADRYPVGKQVAVTYDPDDPGTAALEIGLRSDIWILLGVGALFCLIGLAGVLDAIISVSRR